MTATDNDWKAYVNDIIAEVMSLAVKYGGSISGEHGIGLTKRIFMPLIFSEHDLSIMRQIKQTVDPNYILNTGKIFNP